MGVERPGHPHGVPGASSSVEEVKRVCSAEPSAAPLRPWPLPGRKFVPSRLLPAERTREGGEEALSFTAPGSGSSSLLPSSSVESPPFSSPPLLPLLPPLLLSVP